jgi:Carboxypeptidase regulatory-like domain
VKRFSQILVTVFAFVLIGHINITPAHAQAISANGGSIQGTITDQGRAAVAGADIKVSSKESGFSRTLKADAAGFYSIGPLNPGTYQVQIEAAGFSKLLVETVVRTGTATPGSYQLSVGSATTEIQVNAGAVQVNTEQPGVSGVITAKQIDTLPINGRNFLDLAQIEPGVQLQDGNSFDPTKAGYSALAVNGISGRTTRIVLDGQDITDENVGTTIVNVSQGAIDEFQINHSTQDVSGDLTSTGQVLVSTRSGNNGFHGQAFYNFQDHDAGFATIEGVDVPFQRNQFGGRIGGPIFKDKLFFFANSERIKQEQSAASSLGSLLGGIQSEFPTIGSPFRETYSTARMDYNGPFSGHYFARIYYDNNASVSGSSYSLYSNRDNTPGIVGGADFATGKFTHSFRGGYEKFHNLIGDDTAGNSSLYNPFPALNIEYGAQGLYTGPNANAPQATFQSDKQIRYDGSWTHGAHNVRYGVEFNRLLGGGYASFFGLAPRAYLYAATLTDGGNASDPLDYAFRYLYVGNGEGYFSEKPGFNLPGGGQEDSRFAFYLTDAWKVRPDLTLTAGIRYNRDTERANQDLGVIPCSAIDATLYPDPICSGSAPLLDQFGAGLGKKVNQPNGNFGPQVGFAYSVGGKANTVIRGGFGVYYDSNIWNNILFDRENRLQKGLFNAYNFVSCLANPHINFPGGVVVNSVDGVPLSTLCTEPLATSAKYITDLQSQYQAAVAAAGPALNPAFVGETLNIPSSFYAPNYVSPYSLQMNFGLQHQITTGAIISVDFVHSATLKIQQSIDVNHVGAARYLNTAAAQNAISATLAEFGATSIDQAIAAGAQIEDFMGNGLDSGNDYLGGDSALYEGLTPNTGAAFGGKNGNLGVGSFNFPSGRAGYDSLQIKLQEQKSHPIKGIADSNFQVSYNFSRAQTTSRGGSNAFFTAGAWNQDYATRYMGDSDLDHRHALSFGGSFRIVHGPQVALTGHFQSAPPSNLVLDASTESNIFQTDVDGDGTTGDLLPGTQPGSYGRQYGASNLKGAISNYNNTQAGGLTPAGQALVTSGLFTSGQLSQLNAVQQTIYNGSSHIFNNPMFKAMDASVSYPIHLKWLSEAATLEPAVAIYNVANYAAWSGPDGTLLNLSNAGSDGSGAYSYANGTNGFDLKNQNRVQRGAGTFDQGGPRSTEFQMKLNF